MTAMDALGPLRCWVVNDGTAGMETQCLGLAEALGLAPEVKRLRARAPWRWLPPQLWINPLDALDPAGDRLAPPWPDLVIATGRQTVAPVLALRRANRGRSFTVQLQDPGIDPSRFDLVIAPEHDRLAGRNVVVTLGALNRVTPARLAAAAGEFAPALAGLKRPLVAVMLGGSNKAYRLTDRVIDRLGAELATLADRRGCGFAISASRRTDPAAFARLRARLAGCPAVWWGGAGPNPYFGYLALADAILVTADSVNMASEACATGKPVYIVPLEGGSAKFRRFHARLAAAGMTRPFAGAIESWSYTPLDETARAAVEVRRRLAAWRRDGGGRS
ncbi:MAG: mitochondrial fission ELM1 family protein [Dongiaceae bacterium]